MAEPSEQSKSAIFLRPFPAAVAAFVVCLVVCGFTAWVFHAWGGFKKGLSHDPGDWNAFGGYFGGIVGPALSAITLAALVYTVRLQVVQLASSDREKSNLEARLLSAVESQKLTAQALEKQNNVLLEQAATTTFFEMVRLHHQLVDGIRVTHDRKPFEGRSALSVLYNVGLAETARSNTAVGNLSRVEADSLYFDMFYTKQGRFIAHYFNNLLQIFAFVDESKIISNKQELIDILGAQLSEAEMALLY